MFFWLCKRNTSYDIRIIDWMSDVCSSDLLDASRSAAQALTVVVPERLAGLDAERIVLSRRVDWRIVKARAPSANAQTPAAMTRTLVISYDTAQAEIARYFAAAAKAWNAADEASGANA